jgi:tRNA(Ile)-lysidine synthase
VLFNLVKGTGIAGLHGIRPVKDKLIRPMMPFTRNEIQDFADSERVLWREDASNKSNKYSRNLIRNEVIPILRQINPSVEKSLWQSSQRIAAVEAWLAAEVAQWIKKIVRRDSDVVYFDTKLLKLNTHRALILSELIRPFGFSYSEVDDIVDPAKERSGRQFSTDQYDLVWDRDQIVITEKQKHQIDSIMIAGTGEHTFHRVTYKVEIVNKQDWKLQRSNEVLQADADKLQWPLTLRTWQEGDSIQPLGMKGRMKVSDILINEKVPVNLKSRQTVMEDQLDIIWLSGLRMSNRYKVADDTSSVLLITRYLLAKS